MQRLPQIVFSLSPTPAAAEKGKAQQARHDENESRWLGHPPGSGHAMRRVGGIHKSLFGLDIFPPAVPDSGYWISAES